MEAWEAGFAVHLPARGRISRSPYGRGPGGGAAPILHPRFFALEGARPVRGGLRPAAEGFKGGNYGAIDASLLACSAQTPPGDEAVAFLWRRRRRDLPR